jgi:NAD kinase
VQLDSETIRVIKTSLTQAEETHHRLLEITSQTNPKQPVETEAHELGHHLHEEEEEEEEERDRQRDRQRSAV